MTPCLFVYGTLLPDARSTLGSTERKRLAADGHDLGAATVNGTLLHLGEYPGLIPSQGLVHGVLYELFSPASTLAWLDLYEGITPGARCDYCRREIAVTTTDNVVMIAWTYVFVATPSKYPVIAAGRWGDSIGR